MELEKKPAAPAGDETVLAESPLVLALICVVCGAVAGVLLPLLAHGMVRLRWVPFKGLAELLTSVPEPWLTLGGAGVGALLGLLVGFLAVHESLAVRISDERIVLTVRDASREFPRRDVASAHRDGKELVLLAPDGAELAREKSDLSWPRLAEALTAHGHRWEPEDPHRETWRRWVPGTPGLPEGADALLKARATARKQDDADDARELAEELRRLGVTVRDEKKRQYWRPSPRRA
ncbi:YqeB family protein [Streptomyces cellulosae]